MNQLKKYVIYFVVATLMIQSTLVFGKENKKATLLQPETVYYYDLNFDGKTEKIYYTLEGMDNGYGFVEYNGITVYINDQVKFRKDFEFFDAFGGNINYYIMDLNKNDRKLDFFLSVTDSRFSTLVYSAFQQYENGKIVNIATNKSCKDLNKGMEYTIKEIDGKGNFSLNIFTPFKIPSLGLYWINVPMKYKNKKISQKKVSSYKIEQTNDNTKLSNGKYILNKNIALYQKSSKNSKVIDYVYKGEKVRLLKLVPLTNTWKDDGGVKEYTAYAYVQSNSGKKGWIYLDKQYPGYGKGIFKQVLTW